MEAFTIITDEQSANCEQNFEQRTMLNERLHWLDNLRGFTIFFVVLGHIALGNLQAEAWGEANTKLLCIKNISYSFHMPLMFVISGYAFGLAYVRKDGLKFENIKKQLVNFAWSYVLWSVITVIAQQVVPGATSPDTFGDLLWIGFKSLGIYWYLYVLFFLYLIGTLIAAKGVDLRCVLCVGVVICLLHPLYGGVMSWTIIDVLQYLVFFVLGMILCKGAPALRGVGLAAVGICGIVVIAYGVFLAFNGTMLSNLSIPVLSAVGADKVQ